MAAEVSIEVSPWLKSLPVAPEYHPTSAEFQDPIAYIFKIEKEASQYGICKIVPPLPAASRKTILANLNKSLLTRSTEPTFTTRQQQIGFCPRKHRPVQKPVWQSGEKYTLLEFEAKAKNFEKTYLKKYAKKTLNPLETETLYWNAIVDKPFSVEYANDMPGSAFAPKKSGGRKNEGALTVGDTDWNMRHASRANTSLLKFMKEEIPGVTSPMVYVAMMFSWFAWHVEDHDLHSLNYLHMGAGKTWYGVPRDAAVAFEEVIREHGYSGEINPLVTFATLGEKTTVMSPEVLLSAGVPCCRLVQNAGDFVVTFPRAYHSGFSHGFNCGEAANIATPEWLRVAKEAAIRRASINCPPMVSHFQLLYDLALSLCSRVPKDIVTEPRSSRLKDKRKCEGEMLIKELFSQDMKQNNELLHVLGKGSSVVLLPQNSLSSASCSISQDGLQSQARNRLFPSLCSPNLGFVTTKYNTQDEFILERKQGMRKVNDYLTGKNSLSEIASLALQTEQVESDIKKASHSEQGLFSCVTCGILCFACVAIIQPTEAAASYLMSADCSSFDDWRVSINKLNNISDTNARMKNDSSVLRKNQQGFVDVPIPSANQIPTLDEERTGMVSNSKKCEEPSSLGLLALAYGISSESEDEEGEAEFSIKGCGTGESTCPVKEMASSNTDTAVSENHCGREVSDSHAKFGLARATSSDGVSLSRGCSNDLKTINCTVVESNSLTPNRFRHQIESRNNTLPCKPVSCKTDSAINANLTPFETTTVSFSSRPDATISASFSPFETSTMSFSSRPDEDSSRSHVFCLQHAMQVEKWLTSVGGAHVFLVCHPDYPKLESEARKVAQELQSDFDWREVSFREATVEDEDMVSAALDSENAIHGNGDWAVKLGINLFYSANLSRSPLYCKQMPYNFIIYSAFGRSSPSDRHATNIESEGKRIGRQRKIVAGKWCGKVWTSTQAHPLLVNKDAEELEPEVDVASCGKLDLLHKRTSERDQASEIDTTMCKSRRARNGRVQIGSILKAKSLEMQAEVESCRDFDCHKQTKRKRATTQLKKEILESDRVDESCEEFELSNTCNQIKGKRGTKRIKKETLETEDSESSLGELLLSSSWKPIKSKRGARQTKKEMAEPRKNPQKSKNKHFDALTEDDMEGGPSTRLRKRTKKTYKDPGPSTSKVKPILKQPQKETITKKALTLKTSTISSKAKSRDEEGEYLCDMEGCAMSFGSKQELSMHKRNICPVKGCGKKFFSHKYLLQHRRVHMDDRPLKCPWKGCKMTFKWAWARTEHLRVHTGARPYVCTVSGCGQTFRFVSDFSRHKRKTGHCPKKPRG